MLKQSLKAFKLFQHRFNILSTRFNNVKGGWQTLSTLPFNKIERMLKQMLKPFARALREQVLNLSNSSRSSTVTWNNRNILIDGKSVFYQSLFDKGIATLENLVTDTNVLLLRQDPNVLSFTPLEWFHLIQIFEALPTQWRKSLTSCGPKSCETFLWYNQIKLYLKNQAIQIESVLSKNVYSEIRAGYETRPTAQARFEEQFPDICLDWHDIYKLPFNVLI